MTDQEYRDKALMNYIKAVLDLNKDFSDEQIIGMFLEKKIGVELFADDLESRIGRITRELLSSKYNK